MDIRHLTDVFAVSPQIQPSDARVLAEAGFTDVICNRPDTEVDGPESSDSIAAACERSGLRFHRVPVDHGGISEALIAEQGAALDAARGAVLGYCRSGTRSAHIWAMSRASDGADADDLIAAGARGGYDLSALRPTLEALARR